MKDNISLYIADDHQIVIDGLMLLLKNEPGIVLSGHANNGDQACKDIEERKPDIALIDLRMPGKDGLQVIRHLTHKTPTRFIILSMHNDKRYITDAMNYGADGYLLKNTGKEELLNCIHAVMNNQKSFPVLNKTEEDASVAFLTPRELDIMKLVLNEYTSQQIAEKLSLSQYTVDTHRKNILKKVGVKNLAGLAKYAIDNNIDYSEPMN